MLKAWDAGERDRWERMRILACVSVQPWAKDTITPERLLPLRWDKDKAVSPDTGPEAREAAKKRFDRLIRALNGGQGQHDKSDV